MALRATGNVVLSQARTLGPAKGSHVATLYKAMVRELPRVLQIYDLDIPVSVAQKAIRAQFEKNKV
jgi:hypothetical protein